MNKKNKEKSVLRKEGNVYVLDMFVKVPRQSSTSLRKLMQSMLEMEERKGNALRSIAANRLMGGRRIERGRQVQANCESQSECDSALSVKIDGNDLQLDGETDD